MLKAFRDTWELGIHSYLTYLRDRIQLAHQLLNETGSIFIQISQENVHSVRQLLDEVFGSKNFVSLISFSTTSGFNASSLSRAGDYILWYGKNSEQLKYNQHYKEKILGFEGSSGYDYIEYPNGATTSKKNENIENIESTDIRIFSKGDLQS
jgi:adenine-specific DNA-methyltransferase